MSNPMVEISVWVCLDSSGDYAVGKEESGAIEAYESEVQGLAEAGGYRLVEITVKVPLPTRIELTGDVPPDASNATLAVK